eukprot:g5207.t1
MVRTRSGSSTSTSTSSSSSSSSSTTLKSTEKEEIRPRSESFLDEEDDEEIDSDDAFLSEDEDMYGSTFSAIRGRLRKEASDRVDSRKEQEDSEGNYVDNDENDDDDDDKEEEEEEEEEESGGIMLSDMLDDSSDGAHSRMLDAVRAAGLKAPRSSQKDASSDSEEQNAVGKISSTNLQAAGKTLTADMLLGSLKDSSSATALRKRARAFENAPSAVSAPGSRIVEERAERKLGYSETTSEVTEWQQLVKENREAAHLVYPQNELPRSKPSVVGLSTTSESTADSMEKDIDKLLEESGYGQDASQLVREENKELELVELTEEEVKARRAELAKMRALMFYQEQKHKRTHKIKSKAYHRIRKRQKNRHEREQREALRAVDPEAARELDENDARRRAEERFSLRHKNTSRWAISARKRGQVTKAGTREAIQESLRIGQELRRKMQSMYSDEDASNSDDDSSSGSDGESGSVDRKVKARGKAEALLQSIDEDGHAEAEGAVGDRSGLMSLKFMQNAMEKQRAAARTEAKELLRSIDADIGAEEGSAGEADEQQGSAMPARRKFGNVQPKQQERKARLRVDSLDGSEASDVEDGGEAPPAAVKRILRRRKGEASGKSSNAALSMKRGFRAVSEGASVSSTSVSGIMDANEAVVHSREDRAEMENGEVSALSWATTDGIKWAGASGPVPRWDDLQLGQGKAKESLQVKEEGEEEEASADVEEESLGSHDRRREHRGKVVKGDDSGGKKDESAETSGSSSNPWMVSSSRTLRGESSGKGKAKKKKTKKTKGSESSTSTGKEVMLDVEGALKSSIGGGGGGGGAPPQAAEEADEGRQSQQAQIAQDAITEESNRDLVRQAFAISDSAEKDFEREKEELISSEGPKVEPVLAGWGDWTGEGIKTSKRKRKNKKKQLMRKAAQKHAQAKKAPRRDAALKHVIINEKRNKRISQYLVEKTPYMFGSKDQYERSMRQPLGPEWNTMDAHSELSRPEVITRMGTIIDPVKMPEGYKRKSGMSSFEESRKKKRQKRSLARKTRL